MRDQVHSYVISDILYYLVSSRILIKYSYNHQNSFFPLSQISIIKCILLLFEISKETSTNNSNIITQFEHGLHNMKVFIREKCATKSFFSYSNTSKINLVAYFSINKITCGGVEWKYHRNISVAEHEVDCWWMLEAGEGMFKTLKIFNEIFFIFFIFSQHFCIVSFPYHFNHKTLSKELYDRVSGTHALCIFVIFSLFIVQELFSNFRYFIIAQYIANWYFTIYYDGMLNRVL